MFQRIMNQIFKPFDFGSDEYREKFIDPLKERATKLGIPEDEQALMWQAALKQADPLTIGQAPGSLMRNLIDNWEVDRAGLMKFLGKNDAGDNGGGV